MNRFEQPAPLNLTTGNLSDNWKKFEQRFLLYLSAIGYRKDKDEDKKVSTLLHVAGEDAIDFFNTIENGHQKNLDEVLLEFEHHCCPKKNETVERYKFNCRNQREGESVSSFVTQLKMLAKTCEFGDLRDSLIRDRIVCGILSTNIREKLLSKEDLTLDKTIKILNAVDLAKEGSTVISECSEVPATVKEEVNIDAVGTRGRGFRGRGQPFRSSQQYRSSGASYRGFRGRGQPFRSSQQYRSSGSYSNEQCTKCGLEQHDRELCPANNTECYKCGLRGHYARVCNTKAVHQVEMQQSDQQVLQDIVIESLDIHQVGKGLDRGKDWVAPLMVEGLEVQVKLDTGAHANVLTSRDYQQLPTKPPIFKVSDRLIGYNGGIIPHDGIGTFNITCKGNQYSADFYVVTGPGFKSLLGRTDCERFGLVARIDEVAHSTYAGSLDDPKYSELFNGLGCLPGEYKVRLKPEVKPVIHPCRKVPFPMLEKVKTELDRMEGLGVIAKVHEPTDWVSSMVIATKKNGDVRVCLDPRDLNRAVMRSHFKLPSREEAMAKFTGATCFSTLDATSGFWQKLLAEDSTYLCTFNTPFGRYRYLRLPFGLSSAPEVFHQSVNELFEGLKGVDTSMDDIIVWGPTMEEHDSNLEKVFQVCMANNLKLNKTKCKIGVKELVYLGDLLTSEGIKPDPRKVSAINNMERPKDKQGVQRFLGMITYLAKWMPGFSEKSAPLRQLMNQKNLWEWTSSHEQSWKILKEMVTSQPVLQYYDPNRPTKISTDASKDGLGAVLLQLYDEVWKPVSYASRALLDAETRYAQIEKELLSIKYGCMRFHQFIHGATVEAETDHKALETLFQKPLVDCPLRIQKMMLKLQQFDLKVKYVPGKSLAVADALSRATDTTYDRTSDEQSIKDMDIHIQAIMKILPVTDTQKEKIMIESQKDKTMQELMSTIMEGWPKSKNQCSERIKIYWSLQEELSVVEGLIFKGSRLVIPRAMRQEMLDKIHEGHMGISKSKQRSRESVYWPGISVEVDNMIQGCSTCV